MSFASALVAPDEQARIVALRGLQAADMACADIADGVRAALSSPVVRVRCAALRRWARIGDSVDESIRQSLLHRERAVRLCALVAVVRCGGENAADAARYALHDSHPNVVLVALRAIWVRRLLVDPAAIVVLVQHADRRVRAQAMVALARLAPAESLHYLTETLAHGELTEQRALVRCLGRHQVAGAAALLRPLLVNGHPLLAAALAALGELRDTTALRPMLSFLCSSDPLIRCTAQAALVAVGDPSIAPALRGALSDPRLTVRVAALQVLTTMGLPYPFADLVALLPFLEERDVRGLVAPAFSGEWHEVVARIRAVQLGPEVRWSKPIRTLIRRAIRAHPDAAHIVQALSSDVSGRMVLLLQPFFADMTYPLPVSAAWVQSLHLVNVQRGTVIWQRLWQQFVRDGYGVATFFAADPARALDVFGTDCLASMDERWLQHYRAHGSELHAQRYIQTTLQHSRAIPGYAGALAPAAVEWLTARQARARGTELVAIEAIVALRASDDPQRAAAVAARGVYGDVDALAAWLTRSQTSAAHLLRGLHSNPCVQIDGPLRERIRAVLRTVSNADEIITPLLRSPCPAVHVTLLPWYLERAFPAPNAALRAGMIACFPEHADAVAIIAGYAVESAGADGLFVDVETVQDPMQHWCEDDAGDADEEYPREQGIQTCE